jgi:site-specific recombinase XerD
MITSKKQRRVIIMQRKEALSAERRVGIPVLQLVEECEEYLRSLGYSKHSMRMYCEIWERFSRYAAEQNQEAFTASFAEQYLREEYGITDGTAETAYRKNLVLAMRRLSDYNSNGELYTMKVRVKLLNHPEIIRQLLDAFYGQYSRKVVPSTLSRAKHDIEKFTNYLTGAGIEDFRFVTLDVIHEFILTLRGYSPKTITDMISRIRFLCKFAFERGYHDEDLSLRVSTTRAVANRYVPTTYTPEEKERLLAAVDRGNPVGKRDYAILLLATRLGMRAGDIRDIKLENLHWDTDSIEFTQRKTNMPISLPLLADVGDAIIDYLKHGRPQTQSRNIFISHIAPHREFGEHNSLYRIMGKHLSIAGIDTHGKQRGLHTLRHSLAGALLENNVSLPLISGILGHVDTNTTGEYLKIDLNNLRKCALEVSL